MINVLVREELLLEMLLSRVMEWEMGRDNIDLFEDYYNNLVYSGAYDGCEVDIKDIVDNDIINKTRVVYNSESDFKDFLEDYNGDKTRALVLSTDEERLLILCREENIWK